MTAIDKFLTTRGFTIDISDDAKPIIMETGLLKILMIEYAKLKCKEQRKLCKEQRKLCKEQTTELFNGSGMGIRDIFYIKISNAPEPKFD